MIAILLAASGIPAGRLEVPLRIGAYPDVGPGRWNDERPNPLQTSGLADHGAVRTNVGRFLASSLPNDPRREVKAVAQTGSPSRADRIFKESL